MISFKTIMKKFSLATVRKMLSRFMPLWISFILSGYHSKQQKRLKANDFLHLSSRRLYPKWRANLETIRDMINTDEHVFYVLWYTDRVF